jgi:hypothetical protein
MSTASWCGTGPRFWSDFRTGSDGKNYSDLRVARFARTGEKIDLLRWEFIDEAVFFHYFDIDKILGYLLRLMIALRWFRLERPAGESLFRELLEKMEKSYQLPEEFQRKK